MAPDPQTRRERLRFSALVSTVAALAWAFACALITVGIHDGHVFPVTMGVLVVIPNVFLIVSMLRLVGAWEDHDAAFGALVARLRDDLRP